MRLKLSELKKLKAKDKKIRIKNLDKYKKINKVLYHLKFLFIYKII